MIIIIIMYNLFYSVCSIFQRLYVTTYMLTSFSYIALSSLLRILSSPCRCLSLFSSLSARLLYGSIPCIFVSLSTIVLSGITTNFGVMKLNTPWKKSDILDCHIGVTWLDAAHWLVVSRRSMFFFLILRHALILIIIGLYSDQMWK